MKKIKYLWENWGFRNIDDYQPDFLLLTIVQGKVTLKYGSSKCFIQEVHEWKEDVGSLETYFSSLKAFQASTDIGYALLDGWNETIWVDDIKLSHLAEHPLAMEFIKKVNRLLTTNDLLEDAKKKFRLINRFEDTIEFLHD